MNCQEAKDHLDEFYDQECAPDLRQRIVSHLAGCDRCRRQLDEWVVLSERVFSARGENAPPFFWTRVRSAIEARESQAPGWFWTQWAWMSKVTAAASVLVALGSVLMLQQATPSLENLLDGRAPHESAIQLAGAESYSRDEPAITATLVLGEDVWAQK